ncbi:DUF3667 domain-containing protein [Flavobacterium phycosphaerae]|uniref:DUF3667 domain-containing protein n=1 Tax=Flavobacterium phycosphaerae TaxID=2697515 RepID=UPI00138A3054|nr:DUF3667 domain-containing protein [Flavobacterium phycosphaerae]
MSHSKTCLNCERPTIENFCSFCGQKTDTHKITFKHFFFHDIIHGVWHFEKGIWFTLKAALFRPGKAALDYISGKRIRYYNVFYLILLLIGLNIFINHIQDQLSHYYFNINPEPETDTAGKKVDDFLSNNSKLILFSFIPLFAINSFMLFRRKKLNFSEHFIISGMMFLGIMTIVTLTSLFYFTDYMNYTDFISPMFNIITPALILIYLIINYYKTFAETYTIFQNSIRVFSFITLLLLEVALLIILMIGYFTHWEYNLQVIYH